MWLAAVLLISVPAADVTVQPLVGEARVGQLSELDSQHVAIQSEGDRQSFELRDLMAIVLNETRLDTTVKASVFIDLVDGSRILATGYRVANRTAEIQLGARSVSIETRNILSVRFRAPSEALDSQWRDIVAGEHQGDVIVLRRSPTALDQLTGIFHDITDETVEFEFDDQRIPVKREKLEGIIYVQPVGRDFPETVCRVQEANGTVWLAQSLELQEGQLAIKTLAGVSLQLPWNATTRLDFSSGSIAYLGDMDFELLDCTPYVASLITPQRVQQLYGPRRNAGFEGQGLWVMGEDGETQRFDKGLALHSRTQLSFRLSEPYRRLTAVVGIDSRLQGRGNLTLVIEGDNKELFRKAITGQDPAFPLDLDIQGVRRLRILVDFGESLDVADHLNLCNARILK